jgi:hypothetical protein
MPNTFATTGSTTHSTTVGGLTNGQSYTFYVRCIDGAGHVNTDDYPITVSVANPPPPPSIHPVAAYTFDEGDGLVLTDISGNSNHGVVGGASWTTDGRFGNALVFDGVDDWVTAPDAPSLNLASGMTLMAWVFPTAHGDGVWRNVLLKERAGGEVFSLYSNVDTNVPTVYVVSAAAPGTPLDVRGTSQLPVNTWTHLAATYDGTSLRLFVSGAQVGTRAVSGPLLTSSGTLRIGGNSVWGEFFQGRIDEVRVYNRALTQAEILTDVNTPVSGSLSDTISPWRFGGQPTGTLAMDTTQATLSLSTSEAATCRYSLEAGVAYEAMTGVFATTGSTTHTTTVGGLTNGGSYAFAVRCVDAVGNANSDDFIIGFSVGDSSAISSSFLGVQNPLSENGAWDSPGAWADLYTSNGAYASGLNALGRRVTPLVAADQYAEITYDQNPGALSWVGVMTRVQGATNGSGYLAIVYAGEVRLYRADDSGALDFTMLAAVSADVGAAPRRLRLESEGNTHRVYFNGTLLINYVATGGTIYSSGQPGVAASVFGGPQVRILSFEGGSLVP